MIPQVLNDCFLHDKDRLTHAQALDIIRKQVAPIGETETISANIAHGRILAEDITATNNVPLCNNSAVDGYAFAHGQLPPSGKLPIIGRQTASKIEAKTWGNSGALRIFTGAVVPDGFDTIAMQEDCVETSTDNDDFVKIPKGLKRGANLRLAGEDLMLGDTVAIRGERLNSVGLAALTSVGVSQLNVMMMPQIALAANGSELVDAAQNRKLEAGEVFNTNSPMLLAELSKLAGSVSDAGTWNDNGPEIEKHLATLASQNNLIITTGGASRGDEDYILSALSKLGKRHLWQIAVKPGRPLCMGQIGNCLFVGLPGNPVAAYVCFLLYVKPIIAQLSGQNWQEPIRYKVKADFEIANKKPDRREFLRGILAKDANDQLIVRKFDRDGSGLISGLRAADGLIELDEDCRSVDKGEFVNFLPFSGFD